MLIKLLVKEGPRKNDEFSIKGEVTLGRSRSELPLKDPKASSQHAKISITNQGKFEIQDLKSSNGTFVNEKRVTTAQELRPGDLIKIGRTLLEVIEISGESPLEPDSWQAQVDTALLSSSDFYESHPPVKPDKTLVFYKPLSLEVTQGEDMGTSFVYAFGPRRIGKLYMDGFILSADFPNAAAEFVPEDRDCRAKCLSPDVLLNSKKFDTAILKEGDLLSVGQTVFVVKFLDPS